MPVPTFTFTTIADWTAPSEPVQAPAPRKKPGPKPRPRSDAPRPRRGSRKGLTPQCSSIISERMEAAVQAHVIDILYEDNRPTCEICLTVAEVKLLALIIAGDETEAAKLFEQATALRK